MAETRGTDKMRIPSWCYDRAEYLLTNYKQLKAREESLIDELSHMRLYTHEDVLYLLAGGGSTRTDTERVQSSNISNPCEKAVFNADEVQERLNSDIGRKEKKELQFVSKNLRTVDVVLKLMKGKDAELHHMMEQVYVQGITKKDAVSIDGCKYSRYQMGKMEKEIIEAVAEQVALQCYFEEVSREKRTAEFFQNNA